MSTCINYWEKGVKISKTLNVSIFSLKFYQSSFFFKKINLFIYLFWLRWVLLRMGFLWLWRAGATLRCGAQASCCSGFSCCGAWALGARASVVAARGLSSCGSRA